MVTRISWKSYKPLVEVSSYTEKIVLSVKLNKINGVGKTQERILVLTNKNLYNIKPSSFMGLFSRIRRKIPYSNIQSMTVSRFGSEFVVHVGI